MRRRKKRISLETFVSVIKLQYQHISFDAEFYADFQFSQNFISAHTFQDISNLKFLRGWDKTIFLSFESPNNSDSFDMYIVYEKKWILYKKFEFFEKFDHVISRNSVHRISSYCRVIITRHRGCELYTPHVSVWNVIGGGGTIKSRVPWVTMIVKEVSYP